MIRGNAASPAIAGVIHYASKKNLVSYEWYQTYGLSTPDGVKNSIPAKPFGWLQALEEVGFYDLSSHVESTPKSQFAINNTN